MSDQAILAPTRLPLVLVGPILRRVTSEEVSVFVVLSRPATVGIQVGTAYDAAGAYNFLPIWHNTGLHTVPLGT